MKIQELPRIVASDCPAYSAVFHVEVPFAREAHNDACVAIGTSGGSMSAAGDASFMMDQVCSCCFSAVWCFSLRIAIQLLRLASFRALDLLSSCPFVVCRWVMLYLQPGL
jgi:hypothetical protein